MSVFKCFKMSEGGRIGSVSVPEGKTALARASLPRRAARFEPTKASHTAALSRRVN
jgi:hypothetical protein